jgi:outer membrane receptor protein involved in Fe transport
MRYLLTLLILFFFSTAGWAQQPARPAAPAATATGRIAGTVVDGSTQKPVSYASVGLLDPATNKPVNGGVCGDDGQFVLAGVPTGTYTIEITFLGYETLRRPGVVVTPGAATNVGRLTLVAGAKALGEVVVIAQKPLIEEKVDRTVYNAENDQTTRGGDATDVLKRVPLLSVDLDGNVSLRGSSNIKVLINNKPSTIAANSIADALKQIPADQIKTVEVITSPSAKYDAEGSGGIINIITKGNPLQGATLGVDLSAGLRGSNLGLNGSYRKGKLGLSLGGFGRAGYNTPGEFSNAQVTRSLSDNAVSTTLQNANTRTEMLFGRYTLGMDYDFDKHNSLTGALSYGTRSNKTYQDGLTTLTYDSINTGTAPRTSSLRDVYVNDFSGTIDASLNYTHTFTKPQHEISLLTLYSRNDRDNSFYNNIFNYSDRNLASRLRNDNPSNNTEYTAQLDYQNPISKNQILEMGVKDILRRVNSDYSTLTAGATGDYQQLPNTSLSNTFKYNQNVAAGYVAYTLGLPKNFTLKPGLRYEYTTITANFANSPAVNIPDYGVLVPSVNFSRRFTKTGNTLKLAYNRRIQRPSLQFLNPNRQAQNPLNITQGNPLLSPEYTNNYELSYSTAVKRVNLNFSTFVRNTTGSIQAVRTVRGTDTIRTSYDNIGQEDAYGGSVFASLNNAKFNLNGGIDAYYAVLNNNVSDVNFRASNEGFVVGGRLFGSYNITPVWGVQFFGFYRGRQVQLQGEQSGFGIYSLSVKRDFASKRGSIGFGAENFFTTNGITIRNDLVSPLLDQSSRNVLHNLSFKVNFSYRIGQISASQGGGGPKKSIKNDDLKEGGEGGGDMGGGGAAPGGGARPAGAPAGARPTGAPAGTVPGAAGRPGAPTAPADSTSGRPAVPANSTAVPGTAPATVTPGTPATPAPATPAQPAAPLGTPSPGTTTPNGTTPAGSPGGRP